ncbi:MAG: patatin-like phospholipase family protein, partial [Phycisphaeraceae bacterium]|nr:patatin-like phospholipase family protein [Phycisphaeraceae bacterium]
DVRVISGVSGGSIVAALWAYSSGPFDDFDHRVTDLLRRGLTRRIAAKALRPGRLAKTVTATSTAGVASAPNAFLGPGGPLRRWSSNTAALADGFTDLIGDIAMADVARPNLDVVINACELRTGSAFRFGSKESGTWRHGLVKDNDVKVAQAVACSAAYPVAFPAADLRATFVDQHGDEGEQRVILTDGGVYDNLGTSCLMPDRSPRFSTNVHEVDVVIACDAGRGLFDGKPRPYWFA